MILRAAIVVLLVLNLGVGGWWLFGGNAATPVASAASSGHADAPRLRLVSEATAPVPAVAATHVPVTAAAPVEPVPVPVDVSTPAVVAAPLCLRFGPFDDAAARDAVRPRLLPLAERVLARETQGKSARGWRVFLPPQPSRDAAKAVVEQIKAAGISDWYIIANGEEANSIALGRYGGEDSARRREAQLAAKGFKVRAEPLGDTLPQWWLDARLPAAANRAALAAIAASKPVDCISLQ